MAIQTVLVDSTPKTVYTSINETAVTFMSVCNTTSTAVLVDLNVVLDAQVPAPGNLMAKSLEIPAYDTYIIYQGGEKLVLGNGDYLSVAAGTLNAVSTIVSYVAV